METTLATCRLQPAKRTGLHTKVVRSLAALEPYEAAWNRLALEAPYCPPAQLGTWLMTHLEETAPKRGENWFCLLALDEDQLAGVLPLVIESHKVLGFNRPRVTTPQKGEVFSIDFLTVKGREREVIPLLLEALARENPRLYELALPRVPELSPALEVLNTAANGYFRIQEAGSRGAYLPIGKSFEAYLGSLSRGFKRNLARARNRLAELPDVRTLFLTGSEADERQLGRFLEVEASGWKGQNRSAIRDKPALLGFYQTLTRRLGRLGWLEWHFLMSRDQTLAGHLAVKLNRRLILYKIGYDEAYVRCAPGNMLLERTLQRAFASGYTDEVDFLTDSPWQNNWAVQKRAFYDVWLYPRRLLPLTTGVWVRRAKAGLRQMPGLRELYHHLRSRIQPDAKEREREGLRRVQTRS